MKPTPFARCIALVVIAVLCCTDGTMTRGAEQADSSTDDFSNLADAVVRLLETSDAASFAGALSASLEDWRTVASTNDNATGPDPLGPSWQRTLDLERQRLETSAKQLLDRSAGLDVDFSKVHLTAKAIAPDTLLSVDYSRVLTEGISLPWAEKLEVVLTAEAKVDNPAANRLKGEYRIGLRSLVKFPTGWRVSQSAQWISFPSGVADEDAQRELAILAKASAYEGINQSDDPALLRLGEVIVRFVQSGDMQLYENEAIPTFDTVWAMFQKMSAESGRDLPPRETLEKEWSTQNEMMLEPAREMVTLKKQRDIDLSDAEIQVKEIKVKRLSASRIASTLDGLRGDQLEVTLAVTSNRQSKSGESLSGEYVLSATDAMRMGDHWLISGPVRWERFPEGVVDEETVKAMRFENYVAENGSLPSGIKAPDIEFTSVLNEQKAQLKDLRGKVVILDFWATWCGPCQEPMAKMQNYREENPKWKDRVAVVSLSIDDTMEVVRNHVEKRGWTNTFNVWAGEGGWQSAPAKAFRVRGVPTCYLIDQEGTIVSTVHPGISDVPRMVNGLLK